ncbi:MAG TPA: lyase [Gemmatimonadetes bacterium]|jgi:virginiamycin B lyase|nr:lyase [Gemmatimonadota bacterium]
MRNSTELQKTFTLMIVGITLALTLSPLSGLAQTDKDPALQEWVVPYEDSRPRDPMVAPDGRVWFVGQTADYISVLDPMTGDFEKYDLDEGAGPHNLVVDDEGMIWYSGNRATHIGMLDPTTGEITKYRMPNEAVRDPHTLIFDSQGDIWFTAQQANYIGKFFRDTGEIQLLESLKVEGSRRGNSSRPYGVVIDSQDRPWIALFNTNHIGTVNPETFELETYELPENARPRRLDITSDDIIWYGDYARGTLGRLDPTTGEVTEFELPNGSNSRPYGMAVDDSDRIWIVETGIEPNNFVGFDPMTEEFFSESQIESGGGTIRHMYFDPETNSVWFGADTNTVGVAKLPPRRNRAVSH